MLLLATSACSNRDVYPVTGSGGGSALPDCPQPPLPPGDHPQTLSEGGQTRRYILHVPEAFDPTRAAPLVVDFHGIGETGSSERASSPYPEVLDRDGVLMAFPDGLRGPAGSGWNVGPCCVDDVDDVAFTRAVVAHARSLACVDASRIYAVGVLTGGGMAHYLGCHAADLFAAISPAAFDLLEENQADCLPARPITVVSFRSKGDPRVPYAGGDSSLVPSMPLTFLGAEATFARWAQINGCSGEPTQDTSGCSAYAGCAGGVDVVLCARDGQEQQGEPNVAWPLLRRHTR